MIDDPYETPYNLKSKTTRIRRKRFWLRPNTSYGPESSVRSEINVHVRTEPKNKRKYGNLYADISLRDCSNQVSFDFTAHSKKSARKHLEALKKLQKELDGFIVDYQVAIDSIEEYTDNKW